MAALGAAATAGRTAARETNDLREAVEADEERVRAEARRALLSGLADIVERGVWTGELERKEKRKVGGKGRGAEDKELARTAGADEPA